MVKANVYRKKDWTEEDLQEANQYWALDPDNCVQAVSKIAASFGVPCQTLDNRIKGKHKPARKSQRPKQHLSEAEEYVLVDWIQYCSDTAWPLSHRTLDQGSRTLNLAAWRVATNLQKGQSKTFCRITINNGLNTFK